MLIARGLGPEQYGTMTFLLGTFTAVRQLLDLGSSTAFFTLLSQRQRSCRLVNWYLAWLGIQFLLTLIVVGIIFPAAWIELIWRGEQRTLVILAFFAAYMQSVLWSVMMQMGESQRLTRLVQGVAVAVAFIHFVVMAIAWWGGWLAVRTVFMLIIIEWMIALAIIAKQLRFPKADQETDTPGSIFAEFWRYCLPLIPYSCLGFAYEFADRWLLQTYSGNVQQAYYAVAFQFGAIVAISTSSMLNIFWKEIAEAHHQNNHERVAFLYRRISRSLFFVAAFGAGFLVPWAGDILRITLGPAYAGGTTTLMIMFFYPLHQSMGQIGSTLAYATGRLSGYVQIGMVFMAFSIVVTYFLLADAEAPLPGLELGSVGLAIKMVVIQIFSVNALALYLSRSLGIKFDWLFQFTTSLSCCVAGLLAYSVSDSLFDLSTQIVLAMPVAVFLYALLMLVLVVFLPSLAGLSKADLVKAAKGLRLIAL